MPHIKAISIHRATVEPDEELQRFWEVFYFRVLVVLVALKAAR